MGIPLSGRLRALRRAILRKPQQPAVEEHHGPDDNRRYWNRYAERWTQQFRGYELSTSPERPENYEFLGDEWGNPDHVNEVIEEFIFPYISARSVALEIGSGGGRVAARVAPRVKHLYCVDISKEMLKRLSVALGDRSNVSYFHVEDAVLPDELNSDALDLVYSFDVFVHLDLHTMWKYVRQIGSLLRPGGHAFLHTSNVTTEAGWQRFSTQDRPSLEGHYFITPETLATLTRRAGLTVVKESTEERTNFYKARDHLVVLRK